MNVEERKRIEKRLENNYLNKVIFLPLPKYDLVGKVDSISYWKEGSEYLAIMKVGRVLAKVELEYLEENIKVLENDRTVLQRSSTT